MTTPIFSLKNVCKGFGSSDSRTEVLRDINLEINDGELLAMVGFSGTGKTTLIKLLAGLEAPDSGTLLFKGQPITGTDPKRGVIFQNYSLLPWLTVAGNVGLAVNQLYSDRSKKERREIIDHYVEMVGLSDAIFKRPAELSGGMRQRVSVARALSVDPECLLMDEPLSALDALTRAVLQDQILEIWKEQEKTVVLITNSVDEAILMADRIIPFTPGTPSTLGPEFKVPLPRPRSRRSMNRNDLFKRLRNDIIHFLESEKKKNQAAIEDDGLIEIKQAS